MLRSAAPGAIGNAAPTSLPPCPGVVRGSLCSCLVIATQASAVLTALHSEECAAAAAQHVPRSTQHHRPASAAKSQAAHAGRRVQHAPNRAGHGSMHSVIIASQRALWVGPAYIHVVLGPPPPRILTARSIDAPRQSALALRRRRNPEQRYHMHEHLSISQHSCRLHTWNVTRAAVSSLIHLAPPLGRPPRHPAQQLTTPSSRRRISVNTRNQARRTRTSIAHVVGAPQYGKRHCRKRHCRQNRRTSQKSGRLQQSRIGLRFRAH